MKTILPGATIGMLGGGQLGRMSILAGRRLGYRFAVLEQSRDGPAEMVADATIHAAYSDTDALIALADHCQRITLEFENIPSESLAALDGIIDVFPSREVLHICQNRLREKMFLRQFNFPHARFAVVDSLLSLHAAVAEIGTPSVLKTADFGYDGKGQVKIEAGADLATIWQNFDGQRAVLEAWVPFEAEYSVICARNERGEEAVFPVAKNVHRNHILHTTQVPCGLTGQQEAEAYQLAGKIANALQLTGLIAVELFLTAQGWVVNELAPRPHNSGHYTFDACVTSQFEQHIRAICNLPLGNPDLLRPVVMVNLLGDLWPDDDGQPDWAMLLSDPDVKLHLYGKHSPRPGRKMGHFCVFADTPEAALLKAEYLFSRLAGS